MKYIATIAPSGWNGRANVMELFQNMNDVEIIANLNYITALIETDLSPAELLEIARKAYSDSLVAVFAINSPFVLDSSAWQKEKMVEIRERLYREEIADLQEKLKIRGL